MGICSGSISKQERKAQHDALQNIYNMYPVLSASRKATERLKKELDTVKKRLQDIPDVPEPVVDKAKAISKEIDDIHLKLFGDPRLRWRGMRASVRGRILRLSRSIEEYSGAPTQSQLKSLEKESEKLKILIERINTVIDTDIPQFNKLMKENNIPHIIAGKKIKID